MGEPGSDLLPSIAQILKRAGALEREPGVDVHEVSRLPVFHGRGWKRAIAEFLRWSGSTPDTWGSSSVFELLLCHGSAGARALFEAYRHDRLERASSFAEAQAQMEAVRAVVSMAAHWLHVISWDLQDAPRLSAEEFLSRQRASGTVGAAAAPGPGSADVGDPRLADLVAQFLREESDPSSKGRYAASPGIPVFPGESASPSLWKGQPDRAEKPDKPAAPGAPLLRPRPPRV
ncbi:MAG: hypothetical protein ACM3SU_07465 [Acidobacteriota bacterium]